VYEQGSFEPVARVVQLSEVLEKQRINNAVTHVWQYVPSGIVTQDVLDNVENAKQPLVKIYYYHNNHLGTPQELTDSDGDVVWLSYDYSWGGQFDRHYKPQQVGNYDVSESELQPIKFQGQSLDVETGLHYNRFRYYDSDVGMFISRDPIGLLGGNNVFQYAPNPVMWIDPWGLKSNSTILGENITGKSSWSGSQAHHLIPTEVFDKSPMLQRLQDSKLFNLNGKGNGIMLPEVQSSSTTRSRHRGGHRDYNRAIKAIIDDIDVNSKDDFERARKIQSLQSRLHETLRTGQLGLYRPKPKQRITQQWLDKLNKGGCT
jgi:RHS repeat-associated protein